MVVVIVDVVVVVVVVIHVLVDVDVCTKTSCTSSRPRPRRESSLVDNVLDLFNTADVDDVDVDDVDNDNADDDDDAGGIEKLPNRMGAPIYPSSCTELETTFDAIDFFVESTATATVDPTKTEDNEELTVD